VVVRADPAVSERGRAIYVVSDPDPSRHLVLYDPNHRRLLDHLIAHEAGHIKHFAEAPEAERRLPVVTPATRAGAVLDLAPTLLGLAARGVPEDALPKLVELWTTGTVAQLSDTPS